MKQLLNKVWRTVISLSFVFAVSTTAQATDYIKDVKLVGGPADVVNPLKTDLAADDWIVIDYDLNKGAGGDYIYLLYKKESRSDALNNGFITDFLIVNTSDYPDEFTYQGRTYYLVPYVGSAHFQSVKGDLNSNAGGADIHLYYTKDFFDDGQVVTEIYFNTSSTGGVGTAGSTSGYDLNRYANGEYIYMHVNNAVCSMPFATIGEIGTSPYGVGFTTNRIYQQIYGAGELQAAALISAIAFYSWKDNPVTMDGVQIYMKQTNLDAYGVREDYIQVSENDKVFEGTVSSSGKGWFVIPLDIPFNYDGNSNLVITFYCPTGNNQDYFSLNITRTDSHYCWIMISDTVAIDPNDTSNGNISSNFRTDILFYGLTLDLSKPINLRISHCSDEEATLTWDAPYSTESIVGYSWQFKASQESQWSAESTTPSTSITISNLLPKTEYQLRVKALFANDASAYAYITFTSAVQLPYEYGFENGMDGWDTFNLNYGNNPIVEIGSGILKKAKHEGDRGFGFDNYDSDLGFQYLISPRLPDDKAILVSFYHFGDTGNIGSANIGYSTTDSDPSSFIWVDEVIPSYFEWYRYERAFPEGTKYVALAFDHHDDTNAYHLFLDDFVFDRHSALDKPGDIIVSELTSNRVNLAWSAPPFATGYAYKYKKVGDSDWSGEVSISETSISLSNLTANTEYDFQVKALYLGGMASDSVSKRFFTEAPPVDSLPYYQDFENGMGGWRLIDCHQETSINTVSGGHCFIFSSLGTPPDFLISPQFSISEEMILSFYYKNPSFENNGVTTGNISHFRLGFSTMTKDLSDFSWTGEFTSSSEWKYFKIGLPAGTKYISIQRTGGYRLCLDNFAFTVFQTDLCIRKATICGKERYVGTFFDMYNSYRLPVGAAAYTAELDGSEVVFVRLGDGESRDIPAGTPVIVLADKESSETEETKTIDLVPLVSTSVTARPGSILLASDADIDVTDGKVGGKTVYVVGVKNGVLGLYKFTGSVIPAGKAYYLAD